MNIEKLIPKEIVNRDSYIKNILLEKITGNIGIDTTNIYFKFKTDKPLYKSSNFIKYKNVTLFNFEDGIIWRLVTDNMEDFLPKEYLLEEWKVI